MVDLYHADAEAKKLHDCSICPVAQQKIRKCKEEGIRNFAAPRYVVDKGSIKYPFCPGKATWFASIVKVFEECRVAFYTGILPSKGTLKDQSELFGEVFPHFVDCWVNRKYRQTWDDVSKFTPEVLKVFAKMWGAKGK